MQTILLEKETIYHEEFKLLYDGADVEEVKKIMTENEQAKQKYQEEARKTAMLERKNKEINSLLETAEASLRVGLITEKDLENIKQEISKKAQENNTEAQKSNSDTENNTDGKSTDEKDQKD